MIQVYTLFNYRIKRKALTLTLTLFFISSLAHAQFTDSLEISIGTVGTVASKDYQPLWLVANRFGTVADQQADFTTHVGFKNQHVIKLFPTFLCKKEGGYLKYGFTANNNQHLKNYFIQDGYIRSGYKNYEIRAGRFREIVGEIDKDLSSGSLGISGNAMPIPLVGVAVTDYTKVPFTGGWFQFKGKISHGWMGQNRFMKDAYLHHKSFYMRLGKNRLKFFGGVQHFAVWGGGRKDWMQLDRDWKGFIDVLLVREANDGSLMNGQVSAGTLPDGTYIRPSNKAGDHRGLVEGGLQWESKTFVLRTYHQTPFDRDIGITFRNIDKLAGLSITNKDKEGFFQKFVGELVHTKQMTDWALDHTQNYYNNGVYKTGWEYENHIIGTPFFINRFRGSRYFRDVIPYKWDAPAGSIPGNSNIINNRIAGAHAGVILKPFSKISTRTMVSLIRNYGTFALKDQFMPHKDQWYSLQEVAYQSPVSGLKLTGSLGVDKGELTYNYGFMLGVEWQARPFK